MRARAGWAGRGAAGAALRPPRRTPRRRAPADRPRRARPAGAARPARRCYAALTDAGPRPPAPDAPPGARRVWSATGWWWTRPTTSRRAQERAERRRRCALDVRRPRARRRARACAAAGLRTAGRRRRRRPSSGRSSPGRHPGRAARGRVSTGWCATTRRTCGGRAAAVGAARAVRRARAHRLPALRRRAPRRARPAPGARWCTSWTSSRSRRTPSGTRRCSTSAWPGRCATSYAGSTGEPPAPGRRRVDRHRRPRGHPARLAAPPALRLRLGRSAGLTGGHHHSLSSLPSMARRCSREQVSQ